MTRIGIIGGSGAGLALEDAAPLVLDTPYGRIEAVAGGVSEAPGVEVVFVLRHGPGHERLSSSVRHRANMRGLAQAGVSAIVATTVCGVLDPGIALGRPIVFDDLYFPDNRLPEGGPCTLFDAPGEAGRGHWIFDGPFSRQLRGAALDAAGAAGLDPVDGGTYAYALGPRFNTRPEIAAFRTVGAVAVSQTAGPEAVLAGELEIPYCLIGYGTDYANGVRPEPTPVEELEANMARSGPAFEAIVSGMVRRLAAGGTASPAGFVYRFD